MNDLPIAVSCALDKVAASTGKLALTLGVSLGEFGQTEARIALCHKTRCWALLSAILQKALLHCSCIQPCFRSRESNVNVMGVGDLLGILQHPSSWWKQ